MLDLGVAYLESLRRSRGFTAGQLRDLQIPLLERLCRHAARQCDFYRDRLAPVFERGDCDGGGFRFDRWREIPIFGRLEAQKVGDALFARNTPAVVGPARAGRTSGSTGRPLNYRISQFSEIATVAAVSRCFEDHSCPLAGTLGVIGSDHYNNSRPPRGWSGRAWNYAVVSAPWHKVAASSTIAEITDWLRLRRPDVLVSYPAIISAVIKHARARASSPIAIGTVVSTGETARENFGREVREAFGARHIDMYGAQEVGTFAFQCHVGPLMHIAAETTLVELLRPDGAPALPGESGRVIATPLYSYAMPMIRYDIGDIAVAGGACICGRGPLTISRVLGRTRDVFRFRDGAEKWPRGLNVLTDYIDFEQIQIVQRSLDEIEVRFVPTAPGRRDEAGAARFLREALCPTIDVVFTPVEAIPRAASGKYKDFVSLISENASD